jgi:hypothetical protein
MRRVLIGWVAAGALVAGSGWGAEPGLGGSFGGGSESDHVDADHRARETEEGEERARKKKWEIEGVWETHMLVRQSDVEGAAPNRTVNVGFLYLRFDFTKYDRVWARGGVFQRFMSDAQETGFRADDAVGAYTRFIPLPERFSIRLTGQLSAPTSFLSQKEGLITESRITASVDKKLSRFQFTFRTYGAYHFMRYTSAEGGNPNPRVLWVSLLGAEYQIPYLDWLYLGVSATNMYLWLYRPQDAANNPASQRFGWSEDPYFGESQPVQQAYGAEAYLRAVMPDLAGVRSDLTVSYTQGDPSLGYTSALHDGARHVYPFFWRRSSTVYAALSVAY